MNTPAETATAEVLACGVAVDMLVAQVADDAPPTDPAHQEECPHCRAMLVEVQELWAPVVAWGEQSTPVPDSLTVSVMQRVEALAAHGWHSQVDTPLGVDRIASWVVSVVAHRAAATVPGVAVVRSQVRPAEDSGLPAAMLDGRASRLQRALASGVGVAGSNVVIRLTLTASADTPPLPWVVRMVRQEVTTHVADLMGLDAREIDVLVDAILDPPGEEPQE